MIRTRQELDELPNYAVVYDYTCQVWQKIIEREQGIDAIGFGFIWFRPGDVNAMKSERIVLPARLVDDGL